MAYYQDGKVAQHMVSQILVMIRQADTHQISFGGHAGVLDVTGMDTKGYLIHNTNYLL